MPSYNILLVIRTLYVAILAVLKIWPLLQYTGQLETVLSPNQKFRCISRFLTVLVYTSKKHKYVKKL
jgi:hypothetical protein